MKKEELLERSETFLRGFFEKGLPVEDLLAGADPVNFSWIGPGEKEFFDNRDALLAWYRRAAVQKARKTGPVTALEMQCAFPEEDAAEVTARFWVSEERSRLEYRATLIYTKKQGRLLLVHVHLSAPWVRAAEREDFPLIRGRINYEFLKAAEEAGRHAAAPKFTARQQRLLAEGLGYRAIAEALQITPRTVRYYVAELCRRLGAENRAQLIAATRKWRKRLGGGRRKINKRKAGSAGLFSCPPSRHA